MKTVTTCRLVQSPTWKTLKCRKPTLTCFEAATNAVKEVASLGVDAQAANGQVAFDTVNQLNMRADLETYVFQDNPATAMRRDGEIYASMVNDIYDVPRHVTLTL